MNYLTNYYKNLCEELFAKEQRLLRILNEMQVLPPQIELPYTPGPPAPGQSSPAPATPPATNPGQNIPDRPDPRGYPGGSQDPNYQKEWYDYKKWWDRQDPRWKAKNPLPPTPKKPGTRPQPRPGGGYYPGGPARPIN